MLRDPRKVALAAEVYLPRLVVVRVCHQSVRCQQSFHFTESLVMLVGPFPSAFTGKICEWFEDMRATWPQIPIVIDRAYESPELLDILWSLHLEHTIDLLLPRFEACWRQPVPQPICLFDSPFTLPLIYCESTLLKSSQDLI